MIELSGPGWLLTGLTNLSSSVATGDQCFHVMRINIFTLTVLDSEAASRLPGLWRGFGLGGDSATHGALMPYLRYICRSSSLAARISRARLLVLPMVEDDNRRMSLLRLSIRARSS